MSKTQVLRPPANKHTREQEDAHRHFPAAGSNSREQSEVREYVPEEGW